jgi:hypothetical protein
MGSCPELRDIWHFGQEAIMAGCNGQVVDLSSLFMPGLDPGIHHLS